MVQRVRTRYRSGNDKIFGVEPKTNAVVSCKRFRIEIKLSMSGGAAEIENLGGNFLRRDSCSLLRDGELDGSCPVIQTQITEIRRREIPERLINEAEVLPIHLRAMDLPEAAELGDRRQGRLVNTHR